MTDLGYEPRLLRLKAGTLHTRLRRLQTINDPYIHMAQKSPWKPQTSLKQKHLILYSNCPLESVKALM